MGKRFQVGSYTYAERRGMNTVDRLIDLTCNDPNIALTFRKALRGHRCTDCGIDIEGAGQEVKYIAGKPYCEDCFDYRVDRELEDARDIKAEQDLLRRGL